MKNNLSKSSGMKQNNTMSLIGILIATGVAVLLSPLIPLIILGYIILKFKPTKNKPNH